MSIGTTFLGLLEAGPRHGYDLKRAYDERFGTDRPLHYGQVYSTLSRLLKNGLVEVDGVEPGGGPERKRYAITDAGRHRRRALARAAREARAVPAERRSTPRSCSRC